MEENRTAKELAWRLHISPWRCGSLLWARLLFYIYFFRFVTAVWIIGPELLSRIVIST